MPTTLQMLATYSEPVLHAIAELRTAILEGATTQEQARELLAAQITDPESVRNAIDEVVELMPPAREAVDSLIAHGGQLPAKEFARQFGSIRQMGTEKLVREMPWAAPSSVAELLFYHGLLGVGFSGAGPSAQSIVFLPSDIVHWLPAPAMVDSDTGFSVSPLDPPPSSCLLLADDSFLEDAGSLLGFIQSDGLHLTPDHVPDAGDMERFVERLQVPPDATGRAPESFGVLYSKVRLELLLHLANRLGWLRLGEEDVIDLVGSRVREFLEANRVSQRRMLWDAWRYSREWNDLERTPGLEFTNRNNWSNDPLRARAAVLEILSNLEPGAWYSQAELIQAVQETEPDFQRTTDEFDTWYIRNTSTQEYLKGFDQWDAVEGALLRFYFQGPLYWLRAVDLAEPTGGDDYRLSLSRWGAHWLIADTPAPRDPEPPSPIVADDFSVTVPYATPLSSRFRIERFADWQRSEPDYGYQINRRSLQRAQQQQISAQRVLAFLRENALVLPSNVEKALAKYSDDRTA